MEVVKKWFKIENSDAPELRLAQIPSKAVLNFGIDPKSGKKFSYPVVSVENVFVFPGIPELLQKAFIGLKENTFSKYSCEK